MDRAADRDAVLDVHIHVSITDYSVNLKRKWLRIQSPVLSVVGRQELNGCTKPRPQRLKTARRVTGITVRFERCVIDRMSHLVMESVTLCIFVTTYMHDLMFLTRPTFISFLCRHLNEFRVLLITIYMGTIVRNQLFFIYMFTY